MERFADRFSENTSDIVSDLFSHTNEFESKWENNRNSFRLCMFEHSLRIKTKKMKWERTPIRLLHTLQYINWTIKVKLCRHLQSIFYKFKFILTWSCCNIFLQRINILRIIDLENYAHSITECFSHQLGIRAFKNCWDIELLLQNAQNKSIENIYTKMYRLSMRRVKVY